MDTITPDSLMVEAQRLYAHAYQRLGDHQHAQDIVQETLITAWRKRESFDGRSALSTWLTGIMKFKILDHLRSVKRTPTAHPTENPTDEENWGTDPMDRLFDASGVWKIDPSYGMELLAASPDETAGRAEVLAWVRRCMERLPERLRLLFSLREIDDLPVPEAAAAAGVTAGSAAVLLTRARHQLRACLQHHQVTP
jgi:RNA polymerase sigma-70 factor (ECF subfamily)